MKRDPRAEDGSVVVLTAFSLVFLLAVAAFVVDLGWLYVNRMVLSNAVDAAVLAGVQELPTNPWQAEYLAEDYASRNNVRPEELQVGVTNGNQRVSAAAARQVPLFFARLINIPQVEVTARAAARVGSVAGIRGAAPFAVEQQDFVYGKQYVLKEGAGPTQGRYHGNFGALALGGHGANVYYRNIKYGYQGLLRVGDWVDTEPGNMAGKTEQGIKYRQEACPHVPACTWDHHEPDCPRILLVPVVDSLSVSGRKQVQIVGFAAFFLEGMQKQSGKNGRGQLAVIGRFLQLVVEGEMGSGPNYGLMTYKLVE